MTLIGKKVNKKLKEYKNIRDLYMFSFSKEERVPYFYLKLFKNKKNIDFVAYYDNDEFIGFTYCVISSTYVFLFFLAIDPLKQSKGYGSKILEIIKDKYKDKYIFLNAQRIDSNVKNNDERIRRINFYKRNGFNETGYYLVEDIQYSILSSDNEKFKIEDYISLMNKFYLNLYKVKVIKK